MERNSNGNSAEKVMIFRAEPQSGQSPRDVVVRSVEDLVKERIYVSPDYVANFWGEDAAQRYSQMLAEQRQRAIDNMNA